MLEEAAAVGADHIVWIAGGLAPDSKDLAGARSRARDAFERLIPDARAAGVKLGIEPLHPMICSHRSVLCTLEQANDWCDQLDADDIVGIVIDTYAVWWDPNLEPETRRAGSRICAFHVNDWLPNTEDLRLDRGMMGDGVIDIPAIRQMVERAGYSGACEVEIFSARDWWKRDPDGSRAHYPGALPYGRVGPQVIVLVLVPDTVVRERGVLIALGPLRRNGHDRNRFVRLWSYRPDARRQYRAPSRGRTLASL